MPEYEYIAQVAHEANRGFQAAFPSPGIPVAPAWVDFPEDQRAGVIAGVKARVEQGLGPEQLHESWTQNKLADGWVYGKVKDADAKTHPCLVSYADLDPVDRMKDRLFMAIVDTLSERAAPVIAG